MKKLLAAFLTLFILGSSWVYVPDHIIDTKTVKLNGTDQYLTGGTTVMGGMTGAFSIETWIYLLNGNYHAYQTIVSKDDRTGNKKMFQIAFGDTVSQIEAYIWDNTNSAYKGRMQNGSLSNNTWHHILFTWNGTAVKLYVDGVDDSIDYSGGSFTSISSTNGEFRVGAQIDSSMGETNRYWPAYLNHVSVWSNAVSSAEAAALAKGRFDRRVNHGEYVSASTLVNFWPLGEGDDAESSNGFLDKVGSKPLTGVNTTNAGSLVSNVNLLGPPQFNGDTSVFEAANTSVMSKERTRAFSFVAWTRPRSGKNAADHSFSLFSKVEDQPRERGMHYYLTTGIGLQFLHDQTPPEGNFDEIEVDAHSVLTLNAWNKVAGSYDGSSDESGDLIYAGTAVPMVMVKDSVYKNTLTGTILNTIKFQVGNDTYDSYGAGMLGDVWELRVWDDVVLTDTEFGNETKSLGCSGSLAQTGKREHCWNFNTTGTAVDHWGSDNLAATDIGPISLPYPTL